MKKDPLTPRQREIFLTAIKRQRAAKKRAQLKRTRTKQKKVLAALIEKKHRTEFEEERIKWIKQQIRLLDRLIGPNTRTK